MFFKHKYITNPSLTPTDAIVAAAANLAHTIKHNMPEQYRSQLKKNDLSKLQQILKRATESARVQAENDPLPDLLADDSDSDSDDEDDEPPLTR